MILWFVFLSVKAYGSVPGKEQNDPEVKFSERKRFEFLVLFFSRHLTWPLSSPAKAPASKQKCLKEPLSDPRYDRQCNTRRTPIGLSVVLPVSDRHGSQQTSVRTILGKRC